MDTFDKIVGRGAGSEVFGFAAQLRIECVAEARLQQCFGAGIGVRRTGGEPFRQGFGLGGQPVGRDNAVDDTQCQGAGCIKAVAKQHQFGRMLEADHRRQ